jgi:hypothetical protein
MPVLGRPFSPSRTFFKPSAIGRQGSSLHSRLHLVPSRSSAIRSPGDFGAFAQFDRVKCRNRLRASGHRNFSEQPLSIFPAAVSKHRESSESPSPQLHGVRCMADHSRTAYCHARHGGRVSPPLQIRWRCFPSVMQLARDRRFAFYDLRHEGTSRLFEAGFRFSRSRW